MAVGRPDQRAARTHAGVADADAAAELGELRDVAVLLVDRFQRIVRRIEQEAGRQLLMGGAGVEQRRRTGQVVEVAQALVQRQRRSEEHTSELQSLMRNSYAGFCLKKKNKTHTMNNI